MRLQLALDVADLDTAVDFYSRMFATPVAKRRPGYANFEIAEPPLKLVLFENPGHAGGLNHLGVETETAEEVVLAEARLTDAGLETTGVADTECCFAAKTETWLDGPDGTRWEWYVKTGDRDTRSAGDVCCDGTDPSPRTPAADVATGTSAPTACCG